MKKTYTKTRRSCRVTFRLPADVEAEQAALCGEFNEWEPDQHVMRRLKDGSFSVTLSLEAGREYRFRYLLDDERWENDWSADKYVANTFGSEDSVVIV